MKTTINFQLNGEARTMDVEPHEILLEALRTRLGIKSTKCGCDRGDCGSCSVLIDDVGVRSCLILAIEIDGHEITTLEGLTKDGMTPLQKAFLEKNSFQCGYCAPGMIVSATDLLRRNPQPNREEIQEGLAGNLCRCTGYSPVIEGVLQAASKNKNG